MCIYIYYLYVVHYHTLPEIELNESSLHHPFHQRRHLVPRMYIIQTIGICTYATLTLHYNHSINCKCTKLTLFYSISP